MKKRSAGEESAFLEGGLRTSSSQTNSQTLAVVGRTLSWSGDDVPQGLVVSDALFDPGDKLRRAALQHLPDAGPKLVEEVDARVAADRRTKSFERRRSGAPPIWTVSSSDRDRSQHPEEIRRVQCALSGVVPRD